MNEESSALAGPATGGSADAFVILAVRRGDWRPMQADWSPRAGDQARALIHIEEAERATALLASLGWAIVDTQSAPPSRRGAAPAADEESAAPGLEPATSRSA